VKGKATACQNIIDNDTGYGEAELHTYLIFTLNSHDLRALPQVTVDR